MKLQLAIDRLLSGERMDTVVSEFPELADELKELAPAAASLAMLRGASPSKDGLREALASARLRSAQASTRPAYHWYILLASRLVLPVLVLALAVGGYFVLEPREPAAPPTGGEGDASLSTMLSDDTQGFSQDIQPGAEMRMMKSAAPSEAPGTLLMPGASPMPFFATLPQSLRILAVGDVMLDRAVRARIRESGYAHLLGSGTDIIDAHAYTLLNLEGPITGSESVSEGSAVGSPENTTFTFDPGAVSFLQGIRALAHLGNNHMLDHGQEGLSSTRAYLDEGGIRHFGAPGDPDTKALSLAYGDHTLTFISYNQFAPQSDAAATLAAVREHARAGESVIVYAHWSEEYQTAPTASVRSFARQLVDAGALLVLGSHPHVIGEREIYKGAYIYYSLGNFIFDQYWEKAVRCGLAVSVEAAQGQVQVLGEIAVSIRKDGTTHLGAEAETDCGTPGL